MGTVPIVFDYSTWQQQFPSFVNVSEPFAQGCFDMAGGFCDNSARSPVLSPPWCFGLGAPIDPNVMDCQVAMLRNLLNLLTCHIAWLMAPQVNGQPNTDPTAGTPAPPLVGRISDAAEGTVSVRTELLAGLPGSASWYAQTQWGLMYWTLSAAYRTAMYVPGPPVPVASQFPLWGRGAGRFWRW